MHAMLLRAPRTPLVDTDVRVPDAGPGQLLVEVHACGVCRTDLHVVDGELPGPKLPIVPGHEIVGAVSGIGSGVTGFDVGDRVGIPWLGYTCGACSFCRSGRENLCDNARFTGYTIDGGYAEYAAADARYCFRLPTDPGAENLAPWLCAGLIGYRALQAAGDARRIGLYGFGAAAHIAAQVLRHQERECFAFTREGDRDAQALARDLGAEWAGASSEPTPVALDAAVLFAPVGALVPKALRDVAKGGIVVCAGIHMSDIPSFPYDILWNERRIVSIANLTRRDGEAFIELARAAGVRTHVTTYSLPEANTALGALRAGQVTGAAVLKLR